MAAKKRIDLVAAVSFGVIVVGLAAMLILAAVVVVRRHLKSAQETVGTGVQVQTAPGQSEGPVLARFAGGVVTRSEFDADVRSLPPAFKHDTLPWKRDELLALVQRRVLAAEAKRRGLAVGSPGQALDLQEQPWVRALLMDEKLAAPERSLEAVNAHRSAYAALVERLMGGRGPELDESALGAVKVDALAPGRVSEAPSASEPQPFAFASDGALCVGMLRESFYSAECPGTSGDTFPDQVSPTDLVYLEATYGPASWGFLRHRPFDGISPSAPSLTEPGATRPPPDPMDLEPRYSVQLVDPIGTGASGAASARAWSRYGPAVSHCLKHAHWANRYREKTGVVTLSVHWVQRRVNSGAIDDSSLGTTDGSLFNPRACLAPFYDFGFEEEGEGTLTWPLRVTSLHPDDAPPPGVASTEPIAKSFPADPPTKGWARFQQPTFSAWMPEPVQRQFYETRARWGALPGRAPDVLAVRRFQGVTSSESILAQVIFQPEQFPPRYQMQAFMLEFNIPNATQLQVAENGTWVQGYPARDFQFVSTENHLQYKERIIFTPRAVFYAAAGRPVGSPLSAEAERFLNTFRVSTDPPELLKDIPGIEFLNCPQHMPVPLATGPFPPCLHLPAEAFRSAP